MNWIRTDQQLENDELLEAVVLVTLCKVNKNTFSYQGKVTIDIQEEANSVSQIEVLITPSYE